uniref:Uncharacterized protein n=1 Tax=Glossina pallidipes TaxID=7398 RepID=A0A1A9Z8R6_GLOPL
MVDIYNINYNYFFKRDSETIYLLDMKRYLSSVTSSTLASIVSYIGHLQTLSGSSIKFPALPSGSEVSPHLITLTNSIASVWCNKLMAKKSLRIFLQWDNRDSFDEDTGDGENMECYYGRQRIGNEPERWK